MAWNRCTGAVIFLMPVKGGRTIWHPDNLAPENLASGAKLSVAKLSCNPVKSPYNLEFPDA